MARFVFSCIITSIAIASIWSSDGYTVHNSLLAGHVFKSVVSIDWLQCIEECRKHNICVSYNYFPPEKVCELNDFGFYDRCEADDNLIQANGWIHHVLRTSQEMKGEGNSAKWSKPKKNFTAIFTCDNSMEMFADGKSLGVDGDWTVRSTYLIPGDTRVISVLGQDSGVAYGILGSFSNGLVTNESWKCSSDLYPGWNSPDFDDGNWSNAVVIGEHGDKPWRVISGIAQTAKWIWAAGKYSDKVYCRLDLQELKVSLFFKFILQA